MNLHVNHDDHTQSLLMRNVIHNYIVLYVVLVVVQEECKLKVIAVKFWNGILTALKDNIEKVVVR